MSRTEQGSRMMEAVNIDEKLLDKLELQLAGNSEAIRQTYANQVEDVFRDLITDSDGYVKPGLQNSELLRTFRDTIEDSFAGTEFEEHVQQQLGVLEERVNTLDDMVKNAGISEAVVGDWNSFEQINDRINEFTSRMANGKGEIAGEIRNAVDRFRTSLDQGNSVRFRNLVDTITTKAGILPNYSKTIANTEMMALDREARFIQAEKAQIKHFKYIGVNDSLTRPWCLDHLNDIKTKKQWEQLTNNVGPNPPSRYGGGYNCRHRLIMYRPEWDDLERGKGKNVTPSNTPDPEPAKEFTPRGLSSSELWKNQNLRDLDDALPVAKLQDITDSDSINEKFRNEINLMWRTAPPKVTFNNSQSNHWLERRNRMNIRPNAGTNLDTLHHEAGHAMHYRMGAIKQQDWRRQEDASKWGQEFEEIFQETRKVMLEKWGVRTNSRFADQAYSDAINVHNKYYKADSNSDEFGAVSDIFDIVSGITKGRLGGGHSSKYWRARGAYAKRAETFAHYMESRYRDRAVTEKVLGELGLEELMPVMERFSDMVDEYLDELYNQNFGD